MKLNLAKDIEDQEGSGDIMKYNIYAVHPALKFGQNMLNAEQEKKLDEIYLEHKKNHQQLLLYKPQECC